MYLRSVHAEKDILTLYKFIQANPLGLLTTAIESESFPFLQSSHIPWVLDVPKGDNEFDFGSLRGHMARANPQAKALTNYCKSALGENPNTEDEEHRTLQRDVLVMFHGPVHHYITPKFYAETKLMTGKVVPTWNYSAVQVYGRATIYYEPKAISTHEFLNRQVKDLTHHTEVNLLGFKEKPWVIEDAPESYIEILKKAIIGIEIKITDIGGKWKMIQEMPAGDQEGVARGFERMEGDVAEEMAATVRERCAMKENKKGVLEQ